MAILWADRCPLCNVSLKPENLGKHIERVHPRYSSGAAKIRIDQRTCPICGNINDSLKTKWGLSICNRHYVKDVRHFLIKNFYLKLKEKNNTELISEPETVFWMLNSQLHRINALLGWEPEKVGDVQFLMFTETSALTGYLLLRVIEAVPSVKEMMHSFAESDKPIRPPKKFQSKVAELLMLMDAEFELFVAIKFAASGYYDIAVDDESHPKFVLIIPNSQTESVRRILLLRLKDANEQWHGTFRKVFFPYGTSTAHDDFGATFSFDRSQIKDHFEIFKETWNEVFRTNTRTTVSDFENLWEWLEWVVSEDGITEKNQKKATYFSDYENLGLDRKLVFDTLNDVLPRVEERLNLISLKELPRSDPYLRVHSRLADLARGFKLSTSEGLAYYFPCRKWFYNKLMPVFVRFVRKLELPGESFERDIDTVSTFYSKVGIKLGGKSALSVMIEPSLGGRPKGKTSRSVPWRILERKFPISLPNNTLSRTLGKSGEIDLIVYANMNLYLMELKALNLEDRYAMRYMREKAPVQCAKYAAWARNKKEIEKFLQKHGIKEQQLNSVRIVICSSGVFQDLYVECKGTGEFFAIVPEYILFSAMSGLFTLSVKEPFPSRIETIAPGLKITSEDLSQVRITDVEKEIGKGLSEQLILWTKLITFDRKKEYEQLKTDEDSAKAFSFLGTAFVMNEAYLGHTTSWILPASLLIGQSDQFKIHVGTQLGDAGTTFVCEKCKSAIKYYWPQKENEDFRTIQSIFDASVCPLCGAVAKESELTDKIRGIATMMLAGFKRETEQAFE